VGLDAGAGANEKYLISTQGQNRYVPGHASYFGGTAAFITDAANGDFRIAIGAIVLGPKSLGLDDEIKEGVMWGQQSIAGVRSYFLRITKNYVHTYFPIEYLANPHVLTIFEQIVGYYGIHPAYGTYLKVTETGAEHGRLYFKNFDTYTTYITDPNMAMGVEIQNLGNTGLIYLANGSIELGLYLTTPVAHDPSARPIDYSIDVVSTAVDADDSNAAAATGLLGSFCVQDSVDMIVELNSTTVVEALHNTIANQLLYVSARGVPSNANRVVYLNIYIVKIGTFTANFQYLNPLVNVLQYSTAANTVLTPTTLSAGVRVLRQQIGSAAIRLDLTNKNLQLRPGEAAIITLTSIQGVTVSDIAVTFETKDLF
jgi:hypothetical protein